jgi:F0F1-type ATP synthase assembly protein I
VDIGEKRELYGGFGNSLVWAFEFAATPFLFGLIGHYLDGRLGTGPWLTMLLVVFALAGLSVRMYYGYVAAMEQHEAAAPWKRRLAEGQPPFHGAAASCCSMAAT